MSQVASYIQKEIIRLLKEKNTSYADPLNSEAISKALNVTPSYVREQAKFLLNQKLINVRRGPGGGYFIPFCEEEQKMQVLLDGKELVFDNQGYPALLEVLEKELKGQDRVITEIICDNENVDINDLEAILARGCSKIEISSSTPAELIVNGLDYAQEYLPRLRDGLSKIAALIHEGNEGEAVKLFLEAIDGLEWLNTLTQGIKTFGFNKGISSHVKEKATRATEGYLEKMTLLIEAWNNFDYLLIADILEYEIIPLIEEWEAIARESGLSQ